MYYRSYILWNGQLHLSLQSSWETDTSTFSTLPRFKLEIFSYWRIFTNQTNTSKRTSKLGINDFEYLEIMVWRNEAIFYVEDRSSTESNFCMQLESHVWITAKNDQTWAFSLIMPSGLTSHIQLAFIDIQWRILMVYKGSMKVMPTCT
jgi:hypothetical protein